MTRAVRVEKARSIRAPQQRVYQLLGRIEGQPRFSEIWLAADVLERGGGQVVAEFRGYFGGLPVDSVQRITLRPPVRLEFRQVRGTFKALRGEYLVEQEGQGARLTARMEVEAGIPLLEGQAVRMILSNALDRLLAKVKDAAERDLPRLVAARRAPAPAAGSVPVEPAEAAAAEPAKPVAAAAVPEATATQPQAAPPSAEAHRPGRRRRRRRHRRRPGSAPPDRRTPGP
jgi:ribosome-associated toxin RatA of RatAB toxin-antitoxin module